MKKKAQVIKLPTSGNNIPAIRYADNLKYQVCNSDYTANQLQTAGFDVFHLYIVTDDEIKEGEKYLFRDDAEQWHIHTNNGDVAIQSSDRTKKIISTTDPDLVTKEIEVYEVQAQKMEGHYHKELPSPSKSFIEEYCKAGGIDEVDVELHYLDPEFIDKNGVYHCTTFTAKPFGEYVIPRVRVNSHNEIIIHPI